MIYHLSQKLLHSYHFFNVLHYVSVRAICALLSSLTFSFILGQRFIEVSQRKFRSKVREETPKSHQVKNDTPTMGGLFILIIFTINTLLWNNLYKSEIWIFALTLISFGAIGIIDDIAKIKSKKGIAAGTKFKLQILLATGIMLLWYFVSQPNTALCIPFFKNITTQLGWIIIPWGAFIIVSMSNAVNLTDGLDGLATGPLMTNFSAFSVICYLTGHKSFAKYLFIPFTNNAELTISGAILIGTLLGFLWYNTYPAQIFMGDVGSLALGAGLALMALMTRQELILPLAGGIFVIETISVIAQVFSFKMWKKRIFKMAPIHHHYELIGWTEPKITVRFWIISIVLSLLALLTLKLR
ncbi:phospho-N-acetylmuramoyl-pentapeptide-transferase [Candidatus Babeliales bacterium]|nr:phospho-N-acetylmuramoyl-pentapeptide-transferase [Candidatus Babeliales bacterium]